MPGEAIATVLPDAAESELTSVAPAVDEAHASLWRAGTLVYTSAGIAVLFFWLLWGDFAWSMRERSVGPVVQLFLKSLKASDFTMTMLLTFLPQAIGLVVTPVVSYRSDRLRSRWGRRIPYLLVPTPIGAAAMVGIAFSRELGQMLLDVTGASITPNTATLIVFTGLWTIFEVSLLTSFAVLGGLINDVVPRGRLGRFYGLFRSVSLIDGMIFNFFLLKLAESHFTLMFIGVAAVFGIGFGMMCFFVKEGEYPPPPPAPAEGQFVAAVRSYFRECYSHPYYLWCFAAIALGTVTFIPVNTFSIYYAKQLNVDMAFYGKLITYSYVCSLVLAYVLGWLVDRFSALAVGTIALCVYAFAGLWGMLNITSGATFGVALVAHTVLSGAYFTATASLAQALLPRVKFAQFNSAAGILTSVATMLLGPTLGFILDRTGSNYRLTFAAGLMLSIASIVAMLGVYRRYKQHVGPNGYVAPGDVVVT